jgi:hypothetical protein
MGTKRLLLACVAAAAFAGGAARAEEKGLSGLWLLTPGQYQRDETPPFTPEAQKAADEARRTAVVMRKQRCLPVGMPRFLMNELPFEIIVSPERIGIIGEQAALARTIYLNADKFADDIMPTWNGNSYGKWEKDVLVARTGMFNDAVAHIPGAAPGSTTTVITEKYKVVDGGKGLVVEMTFEDPKLLTKPFTISRHYDRQAQGAQRWEYVCDVDDPQWNTALGVAADTQAPK